MNIPDESTLLVIAAANRYYLGRESIAVSDWCNFLIAVWPALPTAVQQIIERDVMEEFVRDDRVRAYEPHSPLSWRYLGRDCDRAAWERVRTLWMTPAPRTWEEVAKRIDDDLVNSLQGRRK